MLLSKLNAQVTHYLCSYPLSLIKKPRQIRKSHIPTFLKASGRRGEGGAVFMFEGTIVNQSVSVVITRPDYLQRAKLC